MDARSPTTPNRRLQTQYLVGYNLTCAVLWTAVLGRVILLVPLIGFGEVYGGVGEFTKWTQTLALLEIVHSALGMITHGRPPCLFSILRCCPVSSLTENARQASSAPPSSQPSCKSPLASSSSGPSLIATPPLRHLPHSTASCCSPGPSQRSYVTAILFGTCRETAYRDS